MSGLTVRLHRGATVEEVALPPALAQAFAAALAEVAEGQTVEFRRLDEELTTTEAAAVLNVSRPHLVRLLEEGVLPCRRVGTHRRLRRTDVIAYRDRQYRRAEGALQALADQAQELGTGYE